MTTPTITGQRQRICLGLLYVVCVVFVLCGGEQARAQGDTVEIVGRRVPAGQAGIGIDVRLVNAVLLSEICVPLEFREVTLGSFIVALGPATFINRLSNPLTLPDNRRMWHFTQANGVACDYGSPSFGDNIEHSVASSPEGFLVSLSGNNAVEFFGPGADPAELGSIRIGFATSFTPGTFEIDTMCVDPGSPSDHLRFANDLGENVPVVFKKGTMILNGPPVARDTTITVEANSLTTGFLPASDPNPTDTLQFGNISTPAFGDWNLNAGGAFEYTAPASPGTTSFDFGVDDGLATDIGTVTVIVEVTPGDTSYVRKTGSDATGDGSSGNPYRTIPHAILQASNGDFIFVGPGTYDQPGEVPVVFPQDRKLTIIAEDGPFETELVGSPSASGSVVVMHAPGVGDTLTIVGFTIRGNTVDDLGCDFCGGGITVGGLTVGRIFNCIIRDNNAIGTSGLSAGGILFQGSGGVIANNWITSNSGLLDPTAVGGIIVGVSADVAIINNTITQNSGPDPSSTAGVYVVDATSLARFDNNIVAFNFPGRGLLAGSPLAGTESTVNNLYFGNGADVAGFPFTATWVFDDPLLADTSSVDLHLTCESSARDGGQIASVPSGLNFDIDGQLRVPSNPPPRVDIGADQFYDENKDAVFVPLPDSGCAPLDVTFSNLSTCIDEQWLWTFGDGQSSTAKNPVHQYAERGRYTVRLIAFGGVDADTTFDTVYVNGALEVDFGSNFQSGCVPLNVNFFAFADGEVDFYIWDFGDGDVDTGQQVTHSFTSPGIRTVSVSAISGCGTYPHTKPDYIDAKTLPIVQLVSSFDTVAGAPCSPHPVQFGYTSDRPIVAWNWDFGDNHTSTDSTPTHVYAEGDTFSVRLIATGECGIVQHVRSNYIKLRPRPIVSAVAAPSFACVGATQVALSASVTGAISNSFWLFGDGQSAPGLIVNHTYTQVGKYLPKVVVVSACGQDTIAVADSITIGSLPLAAFAINLDSGYEQLSVQFSDQSANLPTTRLWRFGDNQTSNQQSPTHLYPPGQYQASLIVSNPCGTDTAAERRIVVGSYRSTVVDSLGTSGDTILYSVRVDSLVIGYDHPVYLSGRITPLPIQGSMEFRFEPSIGVPPFTSTMRIVPSRNLASGNYSLEMRAVDSLRLNQQGQAISKTATRAYAHVGITAIEVVPNPIPMDSTIVTLLNTRTIVVRNTSTVAEPYTLVVQPAQISGPPFEVLPGQGNGATLTAGQSLVWTLGFRPTRKGDVSGWVRVRSNDPGNPDLQITMTGRGIGEQVPPRIVSASPPQSSELMIDQSVSMTFSETMVIVPLDTILQVMSRRAGTRISGAAQFNPLSLSFLPDEWFWPDDTLTVTLRSIVTDTNGNRLDGNADGTESGSPSDDYVLTYYTGPGVYPGDANHDGIVNEGDILPIGRFWRLQGPPRLQPVTDFSVQPSRSFPTRIAAHADCDGNGIIDSADVCPIAQFFDNDTLLPKAVVELWLTEARAWNATVVDAMLAALAACPLQTAGTAVLRQSLTEMQSHNPIPFTYSLEQNYPNPFNPATVIAFSLTKPSELRLDVYDILGRRVATLAEGVWESGHHRVIWDGQNAEGDAVSSGLYFYRLTSSEFTQSRKMLLIK